MVHSVLLYACKAWDFYQMQTSKNRNKTQAHGLVHIICMYPRLRITFPLHIQHVLVLPAYFRIPGKKEPRAVQFNSNKLFIYPFLSVNSKLTPHLTYE